MKQNKKEILKEIIRFLIVGGFATLCDYAIFYLCNLVLFKSINSDANIILSTFLGFLTGLIVNWLLQKFVYRYISEKQTKSKVVFAKFVVVALIGLGLTELVMYLAQPTFDLLTLHFIVDFQFWKLFFKVLMTIIVLIFNYIARKFFVFKVKKENDSE